MKLSEEVEPRLEVVASEPRLDVREPRLLPEEQDRVLAERLEGGKVSGEEGERNCEVKKKIVKILVESR